MPSRDISRRDLLQASAGLAATALPTLAAFGAFAGRPARGGCGPDRCGGANSQHNTTMAAAAMTSPEVSIAWCYPPETGGRRVVGDGEAWIMAAPPVQWRSSDGRAAHPECREGLGPLPRWVTCCVTVQGLEKR